MKIYKRKALIVLMPLFIATHSLTGQVASPATGSEKPKEKSLELSTFTVTSSQDKGYVTNRSPSAFKGNVPLLKIPQQMMVMTRDMIEDTNYTNSASNVLAFVGVSSYSESELLSIRGTRSGYNLLDEFPDMNTGLDSINIDSYEVIRGSANVFYPTSSIKGVVLKTTRKPLPYSLQRVKLSYSQWGQYRAEVDSTGPVAKFWGGSLDYRLLGAYVDGDVYYSNMRLKNRAIHPSLQFTHGPTTVLIAVDAQSRGRPINDQGILHPSQDGTVYTGAGRRESWMFPNSYGVYKFADVRLQMRHHLSDSWMLKAHAMVARTEQEFMPYTYPNATNFANMTRTFAVRNFNTVFRSYNFLMDATGEVNILGRPVRLVFGGTTFQRTNTNLGRSVKPGLQTIYVVSLINPNLNALNMIGKNDWVDDPSLSNATRQQVKAGYGAIYADLIPDRLTLYAALTWKAVDTYSFPNGYLKLYPQPSTLSKLDAVLKRVGVVYQILPGRLSLYALYAEDFTPKSATNRDEKGNLLDDVHSIMNEAGIKLDLFDSRLVAGFSVFDITETGQALFIGLIDGISYYKALGQTTNKGWDVQLAYKPTPKLQLIGTYFDGKLVDQTGTIKGDSFQGMFTIFSRYEMNRKFNFGGGLVRVMGRNIPNDLTLPAGVVKKANIDLKDANLVNLFANYIVDKHITVGVQVANLLDKHYAVGIQTAQYVSMSQPRTFSTSIAYRF